MDETTTTPSTVSQNEIQELQTQCLWLRKQIQTVLILAIIVSATLCLFMMRQVRYTGSDLKGIRPQAEQVIVEYNKISGPSMDNFVRNIAAYGQAHPDFAPIMAKYGLTGAPPPANPAAPKAAAPPAAPAAKK
jgi:hypothetical protein